MDNHVDESQLLIVAQQIRLDLLTVEACGVLRAAEIPHAVIKGVTTARWLYDPPRPYGDVDLLVPRSEVVQAADALVSSGLVSSKAGTYGEAAAHSQLLMSRIGGELDLHGSLPAMEGLPSNGTNDLWRVLAKDLVDFSLDGHQVPALSLPSRGVVLAMHAVASANGNDQVAEDLRRACAALSHDEWTVTVERAAALGAEAYLRAAVEFVHDRPLPIATPAGARLHLDGASSVAKQFSRLRGAGFRTGAKMIAQKLFPSREFMYHADPRSRHSHAMTLARFRRLYRILRKFPRLVAETRRYRKIKR